jgi:hypothetical protein
MAGILMSEPLERNAQLYKNSAGFLSMVTWRSGIIKTIEFPAWMIPPENADVAIGSRETWPS